MDEDHQGPSRRALFRGAAGLASVPLAVRAMPASHGQPVSSAGPSGIVLTVNGRDHRLVLDTDDGKDSVHAFTQAWP